MRKRRSWALARIKYRGNKGVFEGKTGGNLRYAQVQPILKQWPDISGPFVGKPQRFCDLLWLNPGIFGCKITKRFWNDRPCSENGYKSLFFVNFSLVSIFFRRLFHFTCGFVFQILFFCAHPGERRSILCTRKEHKKRAQTTRNTEIKRFKSIPFFFLTWFIQKYCSCCHFPRLVFPALEFIFVRPPSW